MIKGILFDKDGTLVEFNESWLEATLDFIQENSREKLTPENHEALLFEIGYVNQSPRDNSPIASGTSEDIALVLAKYLDVDSTKLVVDLRNHYYQRLQGTKEKIIPVADLKKVFTRLKKEGYKLGVATADDYEVTQFTLDHLGIENYFDFIGTSDRYQKKPDSEMLDIFCKENQLSPNEVIHVGDSLTDMAFSKACYSGVGVLSGVGCPEELSAATDFVIDHVGQLFRVLDELKV